MKKKQIEPIFDKPIQVTNGMLNAMARMVYWSDALAIPGKFYDNAGKAAGLAIIPAPSEKTKIKEMLKDPTLRTIERSMLEIYYESL